jgi:hypothetical protein
MRRSVLFLSAAGFALAAAARAEPRLIAVAGIARAEVSRATLKDRRFTSFFPSLHGNGCSASEIIAFASVGVRLAGTDEGNGRR